MAERAALTGPLSPLAPYTPGRRRQEWGRGSLENPFAGTGPGGGQKRPEESGRGRPKGLRHVDGARVFMEFCGPAGATGTGTSAWHECPRHIAPGRPAGFHGFCGPAGARGYWQECLRRADGATSIAMRFSQDGLTYGGASLAKTRGHSCAVALLQAGVDITVIRDYLGHASISTTSRYVTTNLE